MVTESAIASAARVRAGELSPVELMGDVIAKIEALNPALNAFVALRAEEALEEARAMADRIAAGEDPGPLAGLPFGVKDLEDTIGMRTGNGSLLHKDDPPATVDEVHVARMKAAGAIVVGKTNTPEFGWSAHTAPLTNPAARNPWNTELTPGGSSGGAAAAIASRMVPVATASDGGGSVRIPAAFTGLFGLKPNHGRVCHREVGSWQFLAVNGPLTTNVADAAALLDVMSGPFPGDPFQLPPPSVVYADEAAKGFAGGKVYVCSNLGWGPIEPVIRNAIAAAVGRLGEIGAGVEEIDSVFPEDPGQLWMTLSAADDAFKQGEKLTTEASLYDPLNHMRMMYGASFTREDYQNALVERVRFCRAIDGLLGEDALLIAATTAIPPFVAEGPQPAVIDSSPVNPLGFIKTYPFNYTGNPAANIPCGMTPDGLPVGMQVIGPRFKEELILRLAKSFEDAWPWSLPDVSGIA